eukprot:gene5871-11861_t
MTKKLLLDSNYLKNLLSADQDKKKRKSPASSAYDDLLQTILAEEMGSNTVTKRFTKKVLRKSKVHKVETNSLPSHLKYEKFENALSQKLSQHNVYTFGNAWGIKGDDIAYLERYFSKVKEILRSNRASILAEYEDKGDKITMRNASMILEYIGIEFDDFTLCQLYNTLLINKIEENKRIKEENPVSTIQRNTIPNENGVIPMHVDDVYEDEVEVEDDHTSMEYSIISDNDNNDSSLLSFQRWMWAVLSHRCQKILAGILAERRGFITPMLLEGLFVGSSLLLPSASLTGIFPQQQTQQQQLSSARRDHAFDIGDSNHSKLSINNPDSSSLHSLSARDIISSRPPHSYSNNNEFSNRSSSSSLSYIPTTEMNMNTNNSMVRSHSQPKSNFPSTSTSNNINNNNLPPLRLREMKTLRQKRKLQQKGGFDESFGRQTPRILRNSTIGGYGNVLELREELRVTNEGLYHLNSMVEDTIVWVQNNCDKSSTSTSISKRTKAKCQSMAVERLIGVFGVHGYSMLNRCLWKWKLCIQFHQMKNIALLYSRAKAIERLIIIVETFIIRKIFRKWMIWNVFIQKQTRWEQECATMEIQRIIRGKFGRNIIKYMKRSIAAKKIQSIIRMVLGKRRVLHKREIIKRNIAATHIQEFMTDYTEIRRAKRHVAKLRRNRAAIIIQKVARGEAGRTRVIRIKTENIRRGNASISIQKTIRGYVGRKRVQKKRIEIKAQEKRLNEENRAAVQIQKIGRRQIAQNIVKQRRDQLTIEKELRIRNEQERIRKIEETKKLEAQRKQEQSAIKIQSIGRRKLATNRVNEIRSMRLKRKEDIKRKQDQYREKKRLEEEKLRREKRFLEKKNTAVLTLQCLARTCAAKRKVDVLREQYAEKMRKRLQQEQAKKDNQAKSMSAAAAKKEMKNKPVSDPEPLLLPLPVSSLSDQDNNNNNTTTADNDNNDTEEEDVAGREEAESLLEMIQKKKIQEKEQERLQKEQEQYDLLQQQKQLELELESKILQEKEIEQKERIEKERIDTHNRAVQAKQEEKDKLEEKKRIEKEELARLLQVEEEKLKLEEVQRQEREELEWQEEVAKHEREQKEEQEKEKEREKQRLLIAAAEKEKEAVQNAMKAKKIRDDEEREKIRKQKEMEDIQVQGQIQKQNEDLAMKQKQEQVEKQLADDIRKKNEEQQLEEKEDEDGDNATKIQNEDDNVRQPLDDADEEEEDREDEEDKNNINGVEDDDGKERGVDGDGEEEEEEAMIRKQYEDEAEARFLLEAEAESLRLKQLEEEEEEQEEEEESLRQQAQDVRSHKQINIREKAAVRIQSLGRKRIAKRYSKAKKVYIMETQRKVAVYITWATITMQRVVRGGIVRHKLREKKRAAARKGEWEWADYMPDYKHSAQDNNNNLPGRNLNDTATNHDNANSTISQNEVITYPIHQKEVKEKLRQLEELENKLKLKEQKMHEKDQAVEKALKDIEDRARAEEAERLARQEMLKMAAGPISSRNEDLNMNSNGNNNGNSNDESRQQNKNLPLASARAPPTGRSAREGPLPRDAKRLVVKGHVWVQLWDPAENSWYWYCQDTQVSQWETPTDNNGNTANTTSSNDKQSYASKAPLASARAPPTGRTARESPIPQEAPRMVCNGHVWAQLWDPAENSWYWYCQDTQMSQWETPTDGVAVAAAAASVPKAALASARAPPTGRTARDNPIPQDAARVIADGHVWAQLWDPAENSWYWYCQDTKVSQWEPPSGGVHVAPTSSKALPLASARAPPTGRTARDDPIPQDAPRIVHEGALWVQLWDPAENSWYWYCQDTQVSQWEQPGAGDVDNIPEQGYESSDAMTDYSTDHDGSEGNYTDSEFGDTASGWQEFWDEQAQAKYWYNYETGEATWTRPEELESNAGASVNTSDSISIPDVSAATTGVVTGGSEWVSYVDADTGQEYWYNSVTGETSWD